ncbi:MAG TPA: hypothetical protein VFV98_19810 [Vicinamibacterales bacterium]|nr:hypothetical protein [Vicinamibacterales bacterium]
MVLFAAAGEPLGLIEWTEQAPAFNVKMIGPDEQPVARQFTRPHIYYVGAHTRCACGFVYGQPFPPPDNEAEEAAGRASVAALQQWLHDRVDGLGEIELYACWHGDWTADPVQRLHVTPEYFGGDAFALGEKFAYRVTRAA